MKPYEQTDAWIDQHFDEQVRFLQALVQVPTDTPPGHNAPHAERTAELLAAMGLVAEKHAVPQAEVLACGLQSITNLIVRRPYAAGGPTIALNAHGDVVPPGEGWTHGPYSGEVVDGKLYGRASAVSKSDFATFSFAVRALESLLAAPQPPQLRGGVELHFTYDEEFGGELGPGWLLQQGLTQPDLLIAAGFSHQVVTAHNGCLQMEVTLHGLFDQRAHLGFHCHRIFIRNHAAVHLHHHFARHHVGIGAAVDAPHQHGRGIDARNGGLDLFQRRQLVVDGVQDPRSGLQRIVSGLRHGAVA